MIVSDTNLISYLFLPGDRTAEAEEVLKKNPDWNAPLLWRSEFRNILAGYVRQDLLNLGTAIGIMREAETLLAGREYAVPSERVLETVAGCNCSAYDCEFVVLAQDLGIRLVTADRQILREFPEIASSPGEIGS
jgi:predicted nucleic acid-binding protein